MPNDPGKQLFYPTDPSFFPLGFTPLEYPPYLVGRFDWPRSRRYFEKAFWKRVPELQSFGHAHSFQRTIFIIEYREKLKLLTIQEENKVVTQKKFITLPIWYSVSFKLQWYTAVRRKNADHTQPVSQYRFHSIKPYKTFNLNFINRLKRILIYQSNRIVTEISVIHSNTKLVSVWDPMAHLK